MTGGAGLSTDPVTGLRLGEASRSTFMRSQGKLEGVQRRKSGPRCRGSLALMTGFMAVCMQVEARFDVPMVVTQVPRQATAASAGWDPKGLTSSDPRPHFGLGKADQAASVRILWPDGREQELTDVKANQILKLKQDKK